MMRVCFSVSMLAVCLMGFPWLGTPAYGQTDAGHYGCPCLEEMQAYGECYWYHDSYRHGAQIEATAKDEGRSEQVAAQEKAADTATACEAVGADAVPALSQATVSDDCWYDSATAEYYRHEFSAPDGHVPADEAMTDTRAEEVVDEAIGETSKDKASAWECCEYADDVYADYYYLWDAPQVQEVCRKPEAAAMAEAEEVAVEVVTGAETVDEEVAVERAASDNAMAEDVATENVWRGEYEYEYEYDYVYGYEYGYPTTVAESSRTADRTEVAACETAGQEVLAEEAVAAEAPTMDGEVWEDDWDWDSEYAEYTDCLNAMCGSKQPDQPTTSTDADVTMDCEEAMESPSCKTETVRPSTQSPARSSYDYDYGCYTYGYEYYQDYESRPVEPAPVQADADLEMVEAEDADEEISEVSDSEMVQFDGEVILSLARTLDRIGSTLQSFSSYLTELATAELAGRRDGALMR